MSSETTPESSSEKQPTSHHRRRFLLMLVLSASIFAGIWLWYDSETKISTDNAFIESTVHSVAPRIGGTVVHVAVIDNQFVHKGEVIMELDTADLSARLHKAAAELVVASNETAAEQAAVDKAKAALASAKARLAQTELDLKRGKALSSRDVIPKAQLDRLTTAYTVARAEVDEATEALRQATAALGADGQGNARISVKAAQEREAALALSYTKVFSPADGYVTRKSVEPGNVVQAGQPVMAVVELDAPWIVANFKERQLTHIRPGQKVHIAVDAYPNLDLRGHVESIMAGTGAAFSLLPPENASGNYVKVVQRVPVKIILEAGSDPQHLLRPGMSVVPTVITGRTIADIFAGTTPTP